MIIKSEKDEKLYLNEIKENINAAINQIDENIKSYSIELKENKKYLYENKAGMDHAEKVSVRQSINHVAITGENAVEKKKRLRKLLESTYFGRIDFMENGLSPSHPVYIGIYSFFDNTLKTNTIHDWRAPISAMYYDFELGDAWYEAPSGKIEGTIGLKRQYRIRNGKMEFMLENSVNIHDDILQKELSKSSDEKMKNIVATIQRDQNAIIRNESSRVLIIQGVAGSGKTSIALHRIAFLLYRFKETISSKDILIISPNKVFADYISNVLPELGEEKIPEMGMEELASEVLDKKYQFQTFFEQVSLLLEKPDEQYINRIRYKATFEFLIKIDQYLTTIENEYFNPKDITVNRFLVPSWFIKERFEATHRIPILKRFNQIAADIEENVKIFYNYEIDAAERGKIRKEVINMFKITNLRALYKDFYGWLEKPELYKSASRSILEYSDVFPLVYMKIRLEGNKIYDKVKHLLIDEMQDYTPVQYAVLSRLFSCKKTILGDANQSVNPYSSSSSEEIKKIFSTADVVKLFKSYRSTFEITNFAQQISHNAELIAIERHGEEPQLFSLNSKEEEIILIKKLIDKFSRSGNNSMGIICKNQQQSIEIKELLKGIAQSVYLLTSHSSSFVNGIVVTTAHMAKGLEFDQVIIPFATADNYKTDIDKSMLYIACTRAMHKLYISFVTKRTSFLNQK